MHDEERERVLDAFRRWGYLEAKLDPLGCLRSQPHPELELRGAAAEEARRSYCGAIGVEFMHLLEPERRQWIQERMEDAPPAPEGARILERLVRAEVFEQVVQTRYLGRSGFPWKAWRR